MSYDLELQDPVTGETLELDSAHHMKGGTYCVGGTTKAKFNITYNYSAFFYKYMGEKGLREIYGMTGAESIPVLQRAIQQLGDDEATEGYWKATEGNAKRALCSLVALAQMRPDGVWNGD